MSATINFHNMTTTAAERLDSGTVVLRLTDDSGSTINILLTGRAQAIALGNAAIEAWNLSPEPEDTP